MATMPPVLLSSTQGTSSLSTSPTSSTTGFVPIRAPVTVDDASSDFQSDGYRTDNSDSKNSSSFGSSNIDNGSEGFVSGEEEFDTASERPFLGDPDEENREGNNFVDRYQVSRPFVTDPDEESLESSVLGEEKSGVTDEIGGHVAEYESPNSNGVRPIAKLSVDDDEFDEEAGDEGMVSEVEDGSVSAAAEVPSFGVAEGVDTVPKVKVLGAEEDEENESLAQIDYKDLVSGIDMGSKDTVMMNGSIPAELVKEEGHVATPEACVESGVKSKEGAHQDNLKWDQSIALEKVRDNEKLEGKSVTEMVIEYESSVAVGSAEVESNEQIVTDMSEIQAMNLLLTGDFPEASEASEVDRSEDTRKRNSNPSAIKDEANRDSETTGDQKGLLSDDDFENLIFGGNGTTKLIMNGLNRDHPQTIDGQITMDSDEATDSDEEADMVKEPAGKQLFDSAALTALLKAAADAEVDGGRMASASVNSSRDFSLERHAGSGFSFRAMRNVPMPDVVKYEISEEKKKTLEKIQQARVKFLRLVHRLGQSPYDSTVESVLHRLNPDEGLCPEFSLKNAKSMAIQLEAEGKDDLDFSLNILVLGKTGVGKSATINSIFGEKRVEISAFAPATTRVKEIVGTIDGVKIRIIDTPGLRSPVKEEATNRKILASVKKSMKKFPPDVVLYVDRLDTHARDLNDLPLLRSISRSLTASIWKNAIVTLTHGSSPPPDGPSGSPLGFEVYVAQRSRVIQLAISQAVGDPWLMHPSMMHPVSLVENHPLCLKNKNSENVLPNGHSWRPQLLVLCYSLKILSQASSITEAGDPSDHKRSFGFRLRSLPVPHLMSSLLQSRPHPKLGADQGGEDIDSDIDLVELSDSDEESEDEYDQLPPFKPLRQSQVDKLSKEQRKAYLEEYDYRVKLLHKKQWREELKRLKEMKKRGKDGKNNYDNIWEDVDQEDGGPATVSVPMPDLILPPSFDSDNPSYRYRALEPASQILLRPVLDPQGWDHDCGYDGVNIESNLAIAGRFPGALAVQITKDKNDFNIHLDSSICAKHGETGSTMAGFDIQTIGRQLAYILRSETKFKKFKMNKTSAGINITLLGENVATGLKIEDQMSVGRRLALVGNVGALRSGGDNAYGANFEVRLKSKDFPVEQDQSTFGLSLVKWRGDLGLMGTLQSQFSIGRKSKMAVRVGMNNKQSGQITIKTSSSELQVALIAIVPVALSVLRSIYPGYTAGKSKMLDH